MIGASTGCEILLVDDSETDADLTLMELDESGFGGVRWINDGIEAMRQLLPTDHAARLIPRVILLDVKMPKVNGIDVLRALKNHPTTRRIPVVMMTSSDQQTDREACYESGCNSYVVKPVRFEDFRTTVRRVAAYWCSINRGAAS